MKELNDVVSTHLNQMCTDGTLEGMIQKQVERLISELVNESMRTYGSLGKAIKEKLDESLKISLSDVTLPEYNRFIGEALLQSYEQAMNTQCLEKMKVLIGKTLEPVKAEISAEEFLEGIKGAAHDWDMDTGEIALDWDERDHYSSIELKINNETHVTLYDHHIKGQHHIGYLANDSHVFSGPLFDSTHCFGIDAYLYKLYCARTQITNLSSVYGMSIDCEEE